MAEVVKEKEVTDEDYDDGELCTDDEDLEEGELKEEGNESGQGTARQVCRFFHRGTCFYGSFCKFLHVNCDKGNYNMFAPEVPQEYPLPLNHEAQYECGDFFGTGGVRGPGLKMTSRRPIPDFMPESLPHMPVSLPPQENAWERGFQEAKVLLRKGNKRKENPSFSNRSSVKDLREFDKENDCKTKKKNCPHKSKSPIGHRTAHSRSGSYSSISSSSSDRSSSYSSSQSSHSRARSSSRSRSVSRRPPRYRSSSRSLSMSSVSSASSSGSHSSSEARSPKRRNLQDSNQKKFTEMVKKGESDQLSKIQKGKDLSSIGALHDNTDPLEEKFQNGEELHPFLNLQHLAVNFPEYSKGPVKDLHKQQVKLKLLNQHPSKLTNLPKDLVKERKQPDEQTKLNLHRSSVKRPISPPTDSKTKKPCSRRDELLKQLKAVEDAIARKRAK